MTVYEIDRDIEARKHLWRGLSRMTDRQRIQFLAWACRQVKGPNSSEVRITSSIGCVHDVYMDLMQLAAIYDLDLFRTCERLESVLRRL